MSAAASRITAQAMKIAKVKEHIGATHLITMKLP